MGNSRHSTDLALSNPIYGSESCGSELSSLPHIQHNTKKATPSPLISADANTYGSDRTLPYKETQGYTQEPVPEKSVYGPHESYMQEAWPRCALHTLTEDGSESRDSKDPEQCVLPGVTRAYRSLQSYDASGGGSSSLPDTRDSGTTDAGVWIHQETRMCFGDFQSLQSNQLNLFLTSKAPQNL